MAEQTTTTQETSCGLRGFERNRYFFGKQLTVRDFDAEQRYFNGKRYLLNRLVHSWGVVCGLRVEPQPQGRFRLAPGAAIDCCGREIVVGDEDLVYSLSELEGYKRLIADQSADKTFYICLKYDECIREPVQTVSNVSSCTDVCDYNRIREGFKLFVTTQGPTEEMDFCGLATQSRLLSKGSARELRIERVTPRWVNPKEVFEVLLVVTAKAQAGATPAVLRVEELFTAGGLTLAQGPDDAQGAGEKHFIMTVGPTDTRVERRYLVRAGAAAGRAVIGCNVSSVSGPITLPPELNRESEIELVEGSVADRLVETFFEGDTSVCPSCTEEHALYLASASLAEDDELKDLELFPSNRYVYNNDMLYGLLACAGQRLGRVPEVPAYGQAGEAVVPAVNSLKIFDGVKVTKTGDGRADVSANVGDGLEISGGKIVTRRGDGIKLDEAGQLAARLGRGLDLEGAAPPRSVTVKKGSGLDFDADGTLRVNLDTTRGLDFDKSAPPKVIVKEGAGLGFDASGALRVNADEGLVVSGDSVVVNVGGGLDIQNRADAEVRNRKVVVNAGNGLAVQSGKVVVKEGSGLGFDMDGKLKVNTGQGVTTSNDVVVANVGDGLLVLNDKIVVNRGAGLQFSAADPKQLTANVGGGLTINAGGVIVPEYSATPAAGKVCEANDTRLNNRRDPNAHHASHEDNGTDTINLSNLSGVLRNAQKVEVQKDGVATDTQPRLNFTGAGVAVTKEAAAGGARVNVNVPGTVQVLKEGREPVFERRRLNFTGAGVTLQDDAALQRLNINIPGGAGSLVSDGEITFPNVTEGSMRTLSLRHGLVGASVSIVLSYVDIIRVLDTAYQARVFGIFPTAQQLTSPQLTAVVPTAVSEGDFSVLENIPDLFFIYLFDRRPTPAPPPGGTTPILKPVTYVVHWWAIASAGTAAAQPPPTGAVLK